MARLARVLACLLFCAPAALIAREPSDSPAASAGDELKVVRQMIEQQSKQLDVLAQEIARLNLLLEARMPAASGLPSIPAEPAESGSTEPSAPKAIPADASPTGPVHIIAKGETLTVIAKRYKVTVPDLLKVNKINDVRKLQIGQTLVLPPAAKIQESPTPAPQP